MVADGIIGPNTLTALENVLFDKPQREAEVEHFSLMVSKKGLQQIVKHEISSAAYYRKFLSHPIWPGGMSGITIGIGYDLGYNTGQQIRNDWSGKLRAIDLEELTAVCGLKGDAARNVLPNLQSIVIPLETAQSVFYESTLSRYAGCIPRLSGQFAAHDLPLY